MRMADAEQSGAEPILVVDDVTKRYGKFTALEHVSFGVKKGTHLLILGPNGAGKTTMIKCILNLASFSGHIRVDGSDSKKNSTEVKKMIGYVPRTTLSTRTYRSKTRR